MSAGLARRLRDAALEDARRALVRLFLGVRCEHCADYFRGDRTLDRHLYIQHGDL